LQELTSAVEELVVEFLRANVVGLSRMSLVKCGCRPARLAGDLQVAHPTRRAHVSASMCRPGRGIVSAQQLADP